MGYLENLGNWAGKQARNFQNDIGLPVLLNDIASVTTNDKSWNQDIFQIAGDTFKASIATAGYLPRKAIGAAFNEVILPVAKKSYDIGGQYAREPLSAGLTGLATGNFEEAWNQRKDISAGKALTYLQSKWDPTRGELRGDFNIFDANDRKIFDENWEYKALSGAYDTIFSTVTDPLGKVGKAAGLARKALVTQPMGAEAATHASLVKDFLIPKPIRKVTISSPEALSARIEEGKLGTGGLNYRFQEQAKADRIKLLSDPMVSESNDANTISYLLGEVNTVDDVADTWLAIGGLPGVAEEAMARLVAKRKDMAFVFDKLKPVSEIDKDIVNNIPTNGIVEDVNKLDSASALVDIARKDPYIDYLTQLSVKEDGMGGADLMKRTFGSDAFQKSAVRQMERGYAKAMGIAPDAKTAYPTFGVFQPTRFHPLVAVINFADEAGKKRPAGWFNANDSDSFNEIKAFGNMLNRLIGQEAASTVIAQHYDDFIKAGELPEKRTLVAQSFEDEAIKHINWALGISDDTAEKIWNMYKGRRKMAMDQVRDRKFLMTNDDNVMLIPYLERQGANALPMVDLDNYARVLKENKGFIQAIEGTRGVIDPDAARYISGLANDLWKASVLLRLGYTVRNVTEATLSIAAKGYGLIAAADLRESGKAWFDNRITGIERLSDQILVNKGARENSLVLRQELANNSLEHAALNRVDDEIDGHVASHERAFKRGELSEEKMLEFLDVSSYRTGEFLYHGSPTGLTSLDPSRAFAMSFNDGVAQQYADRGMKVISAAKIQQRLTGRAGRLPRNIERSPADEIGSQAVVERISNEAFTELNSYVNGDFGDVQAGLRDPSFATSRGRNVPELPVGLQRTIQRSVLTKPLTVYRGTTNLKNPFVNAQVGDIIEEPAFVSTSYSDDVARNFATPSTLKIGTSEPAEIGDYISTQIEMKLPKGLNGLDIAETYNQMKNLGYANLHTESMRMVNRESEVLLPAGTKFRVVSRGGDAQNGYAVTVEAILPRRTPQVPASKGLQTIAADMREGFINSIAKGNQVELLNPQTGTWRAIDPESISQKLLVEGQFRIRKPGNQGQVVSSKVFGERIDLRTNSGTKVKLGLNDYPELKKLGLDARQPDSWKGKEPQLLEWMRANDVGKLILPDTKANSRHTVLVDPMMVEAGGNKPTQLLAKKQLDGIRAQQAMTVNENRLLDMIQSTIDNQGGTFNFITGDAPVGGYAVAVRGGTFQFPLNEAMTNPTGMREALIQHMEKTVDKFEGADHFGTWVEPDKNGIDSIWAEPVNVIDSRANAVKMGKLRNQKGVFDLNRFETIRTGGTGDERASAEFALGQGSKTRRRYVQRGAESVRGSFSGQSVGELEELAKTIAAGKYPTAGVVQLVREIAERKANVITNTESLLHKLNGRIVEEARLNTKRSLAGTGMRRTKLYDGTVIEYPDAFAGELGDILGQRTDNANTYALMADAPSQLFTARFGNMEEVRLSFKDPRYFSGYANFINGMWRSPNEAKIDPIIELFLNGQRPEEVIRWLRTDPKGLAYATKMNIDSPSMRVASERLNVSTSAEDFVGNLHSAYQRYLPDSEIQNAFRNGEIDEMWLRNHFKNQPAMPDVIGSVVPTAPEVRFKDGTMFQKWVQQSFHYLGSLPETTLARHPLARAIYRSEMEQRANIALVRKRVALENDKAELTVDEINGLRKNAMESTRKEVNKTLFTIMQKSYAGEKMRYLMPFFNAWENTIRRWTTLSKDNPVAIAKAGQITASLSNQSNVVDRNGNKTDKFSYDNVIVLPMPESFIKSMESIPGLPRGLAAAIRSSGSQLSIPIRSLDVMFQGEVTAGFGPIAAIPAQYLEIMRPDFESILRPIIPYGAADSPMRTLLPPAAQKALQQWSLTRDGSWSRTFNTVYRYELIKWKLGERETEPTFQDIESLTNNMYRVKMFSNLILPFAAQYDSPLGWYTQQYRKLQQTYGVQADALFLQMYPEMAEATISSSLNNTNVHASQKAFENTKKYAGLISKIGTTTPEMIGFLVNDPNGKYDFSNAVYQWQQSNSPVPGSVENFRGQRNPAMLKIDANKKMGWIEYRKAMDYLDYNLKAQGFESYSESGAEELQLAKQLFTQQLATKNKDWASDFYSVDKGKWIYRMQTIQTMLTDPTWMKENGNRQVVNALAIYYSTRTQIARELGSRKAGGGSGTLTSQDNVDLDAMWRSTIAKLTDESLEFSDFYNRFLQNDPVTLG